MNQYTLPVVFFILWMLTVSAGISQELRSYRVTCDADEFASIIANPDSVAYIDCRFEHDEDAWDDAQIKARGESSRDYLKKSFKVNFTAGNRFLGRDKINLISEWRDTSFVREYLAYDLYHRAGLYASGTWFTRFYVNDNYMGLYLDVEEIDQNFLDSTALADDASIYKADRGGCILTSAEPIEYLWDKETNLNTGFNELTDLIEVLETTPDRLFYDRLESLFDLDELANVIAVNSLAGNSSTYYHNYFLIKEPGGNGRWHYLPWDMDFTFYYHGSYRFPEYYRSGHEVVGANTLIRRSWLDPQMRSRIFNHCSSLIDSVFNREYYQQATAILEDLLLDAVEQDTFKAGTLDQFLEQLRAIPSAVQGRGERLLFQFENSILPFDMNPVIITPLGAYFSWMQPVAGDGSQVTCSVFIGTNRWLTENRIIVRDIAETFLVYDEIEPGDYYYRVYAFTPDGRYTYSLSPFHAFTVPDSGFGGTPIDGTVDTVLVLTTENSPYLVNEGLVIDREGSLEIEPGVIIGMGSGCDLVVRGELSALGTEDDSISIVPLIPSNPWGSIRIEEAAHPCRIEYAVLTGGGLPERPDSPSELILVNGSEISVDRCRFSHSSSGGMTLNESSAVISESVFSHIRKGAVRATDGSLTVRSCQFAMCCLDEGEVDDIISASAPQSLVISGNTLYSGADDGISFHGVGEGAVIERNKIRDMNDKGISVSASAGGLYFANNLVTGCGEGLFLRGSAADIYNCLFAFNTKGLRVIETGDSCDVMVRNSVLWRNDEEIVLGENVEIDVAYSMVRGDQPLPGENNFCRNAHFMDQWSNNFYLSANSPLIDAGCSDNHPRFDFDGRDRVDILGVPNTGSGDIPYVDIGIYEFSALDIGLPDNEIPADFRLVQAYPNPFNGRVTITIDLEVIQPITLSIYDLGGRLVKKIDRKRSGFHNAITWNGLNESGTPVGSGVYFCRVSAGRRVDVQKIVLVK